MEIFRAAVAPLDCVIVLVSLYVIGSTDYEKATTIHYVFLAGFGIWFLLLFVRIYLVARKRRSEERKAQ